MSQNAARDLPLDFTHAQDFIDAVVRMALSEGVSDLHFEQRGEEGVLRVRLDGFMREWVRLPLEKMALVISRLKFISNLDPMQSGVLAQGRFEHTEGDRVYDMRLSVLPTPESDDIVVRLLAAAPDVMHLEEMNFQPHILSGLRQAVESQTGLLLVTGPTGSGKTTTLYAAVEEINDGHRKIITVEDPIEYQVQGLTQLKTQREKGLTYAGILRTILRHDPDVILIGEIRDLEAAEIAVEASMTGHLVLSTLHTNSAPATLVRLTNMGLSPVNVANSVTAVYAQRLLRKLCPHCKTEVKLDKSALPPALQGMDLPETIAVAKGCEACDGTGYRGRLPIGELLVMTDALRDVILQNPSLATLNEAAAEAGMKTLLENGLDLAREHLVSLDDVIRTALQ